MSLVQNLRELINERLTAAAEEIFTEFEKTIVRYEKEIDRQRRLLDNIWTTQITQHTADLPQQHVCKEVEVLSEQDVCNQESNSSVDQEDPEPPQIEEEQMEICTNLDQEDPKPPQRKEEEEELCNSLNRQQCGQTAAADMNEKTDSFMLDQCKSKCEKLSQEKFRVSEDTIGLYEHEIDRQRRLHNITKNLQIKLHRIDLQQQHINKEQEVFNDHLYCKQERNFCLDEKDPEPPQITGEEEKLCISLDQEDRQPAEMKDEEEELCISLDSDNSEPLQVEEEQRELCSSQQGGQLGTFMRIFTHEENNHSDPKPINGQLLFCNSHLAESPDQEGSNHPTSGSTHNLVLKTHDRNSSHSNNVDNSFISQIHCDADTSKKTERCDVCGKAFIVKYLLKAHYRSHTGEKPFSCETCGESFTCHDHMTDHMRTHTSEKLYLCKICGKRFYDLVAFKRHTEIHKDEKLNSCKFCETSFTRHSYLNINMRIHTGEKPYCCNICDKSFRYLRSLLSHMRVHTDEKPNLCNGGKDLVIL